MPSKLLQEAANTLLQDTQGFFQLGSTNNLSVMQSNEQFTFINKILEDFLRQYKQSHTTQFFFKPEVGKKFLSEKKEI